MYSSCKTESMPSSAGRTGKAACKKHTWHIHAERHVEKALTHKGTERVPGPACILRAVIFKQDGPEAGTAASGKKRRAGPAACRYASFFQWQDFCLPRRRCRFESGMMLLSLFKRNKIS